MYTVAVILASPIPKALGSCQAILVALSVVACSAESAETQDDTPATDAGAGLSDAQGTADSGAADAAPDASSLSGDPCLNPGTAGATSTCLAPSHPESYYVEQALKYFDTLDVDADPESVPNYSELVARWEWPPWLLLTGYGRQDMIDTGNALKDVDPSTVPERDCRAFDVQPFARCYVVFEYEGGSCPIYEEFTFNDAGETTFIEAWSDLPDLRPHARSDDPWGERDNLGRLSTRVPGLGQGEGRIDLTSSWMIDAAAHDDDVADFAERASDWWVYWYDAFISAPSNFFAIGCGWGAKTRHNPSARR